MCEFISWIEKHKKVYFLTGEQVFHSVRGDALREYCQNTEDYIGHGAIRWFYEIEGGTNKECTDFSDPSNFPKQISKAIKQGEMKGYTCPFILLTDEALQKVKADAKRNKAYAEWEKAYTEREKAYAERKKADAKWEKAYAERKKAFAKWEKAYAEREKAYAEWEKAYAEWEKAYAKWEKAFAERKKVDAEWEKAYAKREKAYAERKKAYAEWKKADAEICWKLFAIPENRNPKWR